MVLEETGLKGKIDGDGRLAIPQKVLQLAHANETKQEFEFFTTLEGHIVLRKVDISEKG